MGGIVEDFERRITALEEKIPSSTTEESVRLRAIIRRALWVLKIDGPNAQSVANILREGGKE